MRPNSGPTANKTGFAIDARLTRNRPCGGLSGGLTTIPATVRELERFCADHHAEWPKELQDAGATALLALEMMNQRAFHQSEVLRREAAKDLMAFAQAYGAWQASKAAGGG